MSTKSVRHALAAALAGVLLSLLREPLGGDVLHALSADPLRAAAWRGLGLAFACLLAGPLHAPRQRALGLVWLSCGFALHALCLQAWWWPSTAVGMAGSALPIAALAAWLGRESWAAEAEPAAGAARAGLLAHFGTVLCAAGVAIALEVVGRHVRLLGLALPADDAVSACVLLAATALGALAFGYLVCAPGRERAGMGAALAVAAALALVGYEYVQRFEDPTVLQAFLRRYGMTMSEIGTPAAAAAFAASAFVAAAFALGAGLYGARERSTWWALGLGALLGSIAVPILYRSTARPLDLIEAGRAPGGARWIAVGASIAAAGALCLALELFARKQRSAWIALAGAIGACAWPWARPQRAALLFSPWQRAEARPTLVIDSAAGLLTVEPVADGTLAATQDRIRLTPSAREEEADRRRLADTLRAFGRPTAQLRLLYIGQLTPARQHEFDAAGLADWRWTSPLGQSARELSAALQGGFESAPQRWIELAAAEQALATGSADGFAPDLALAQPLYGVTLSSLAAGRARVSAAPAPRGLTDPGGPVAIACWTDAGSGLCPSALRGPLQLSFGDPEELSVAQWTGRKIATPDANEADAWIPSPAFGRAPIPWETLATPPRLRATHAREALAIALSSVCSDAQRDFVQALVELYGAQVDSSPWETVEQQLELDSTVLDRLSLAARSGLSTAEHELWSGLAGVLTGKRLPDLVLKHLEPLARQYAPWPALEHAVAQAYLEFDMPAEALAQFESIAQHDPYDIELRLKGAAAARALRDFGREAQWLRAAAAVQPERPDIARLLGIALVRLGDPEGRRLVRDALLHDPDDSALEPFLGPGPYPDPESGYQPPNSHATETPAEHAAHADGADSKSH